MDKKKRPFDRMIKQILARPRVLLTLCKEHIAKESGYADRIDWDVDDVDQPITWLENEYRPTQELWISDKIAKVGKSTIIHIEQQTKHKARIMAARMMQYATYISMHYDFKISLFQVYYYTGDQKIRWKHFAQNGTGAILNRFTVIDAGAHDAWAMLKSNNFDYAVLGLMARGIDQEEEYFDALIKLARKQYIDGDLIRALVSCVGVASLRGRTNKILERLDRAMRESIKNDPIYKQIHDPAMAEGRLLGRSEAAEAFRRVEQIKQKVSGPFPNDFLDWALKMATPDELESLELAADTAKTFDEVVEMIEISWTPEPQGRSLS